MAKRITNTVGGKYIISGPVKRRRATDHPDKPLYHVPTMAEVAAIPWNGLTVASTFSGAGGSSLGYRMAGFKVLYCNEFVEAARDTYRANCPDYVKVDDRDIRRITGNEIREMVGEIDLLDGSPPCASFSTLGRREKAWGQQRSYSDDKTQRVDDLFLEFARILSDLQPRAFIAENVAGLVRGTARGYFKLILAALKDCGYRVEARILDAAYLGVPQSRHRLFFVGARNDQPWSPVFPKPFPYQYSVADAICPDGTVGDTLRVDPETGYELSIPTYTKSYMLWQQLPVGGSPKDTFFNLIRVDPNKPMPMIAASHGANSIASPAHWEYPRKFSLQEIRAMASFPPDFILTGTFKQRWERIGRAVPPLMMRALSSTVRDAMCAESSAVSVT